MSPIRIQFASPAQNVLVMDLAGCFAFGLLAVFWVLEVNGVSLTPQTSSLAGLLIAILKVFASILSCCLVGFGVFAVARILTRDHILEAMEAGWVDPAAWIPLTPLTTLPGRAQRVPGGLHRPPRLAC